MRNREPNPTPHIRIILFVFFVVLATVLAGVNCALAAEWDNPVKIYYNPDLSRVGWGEVENALEYAAHSWSERTGLPITYAGFTRETEIDGAIVVKWEYLPKYSEKGTLNANARWAWLDGLIKRAVVTLSATTMGQRGWLNTCDMETILHEVGHSLGYERKGAESDKYHSDDPDDVMYWDRGKCRYSLSAQDVQRQPYEAHTCFAELTGDFDLYLPDRKAEMIFNRIVDGFYTWKLDRYEQGFSNCASVLPDGSIVLTDVRAWSLGKYFSKMVLEPWNGLYRLRRLD